MKTKTDPRHKKRVTAMKTVFEKIFRTDFNPPKNSPAAQIVANQRKIDKLISQNAPAWPTSQIAPVDLATLRLAIWELLYQKNRTPYKVVVDEAVEIAKEFGSESSPKFINGVLGSIIKSTKELRMSNSELKTQNS